MEKNYTKSELLGTVVVVVLTFTSFFLFTLITYFLRLDFMIKIIVEFLYLLCMVNRM